MKVHSYKIRIGKKALKAFMTKNARWDCTEVEIVFKEGDEPIVSYKTAKDLKIFLLEQQLCEAGIDEKLLEEYGQLKYEDGYDNGWDCAAENEGI